MALRSLDPRDPGQSTGPGQDPQVLGKIPTPPTPPKKSAGKKDKKDKHVSFADSPLTAKASALQETKKLLEDTFDEALPAKAVGQYLGKKALASDDPFASAVELTSGLQTSGKAIGKTMKDDLSDTQKEWTQQFVEALDEYIKKNPTADPTPSTSDP